MTALNCSTITQAEAMAFTAWRRQGVDEHSPFGKTGRIPIEVDPRHFRSSVVDLFVGDASKARGRLGWAHQIGWEAQGFEMVRSDLAAHAAEAHRHDN